jgi:branched-chain amino acid transport system substrate-binding protein
VAACLGLGGCASEFRGPGAAEARTLEAVLVRRPNVPHDGSLMLAAVFPTLGRYAISGTQSLQGARLAVDELNARGTIHGRALRLLEYPTGSYFVDARHAAELAASDGALAIVGSNSSALSQAVAEVAESLGIVQVSNVSTAADLTWDPITGLDRPFVFRVCSSETDLTERLAAFAREQLHAHRVALLYEVGRSYSAQMVRGFSARFEAPAAGRLVREFGYLPLETDFRPQLREIANFRPDVLFVPGSFTDSSLVAAQAETLGLRPVLLGGDGWSNRLLFQRGGPSRPAFYVDVCTPQADFGARYRRAYGQEADGCRASLAYDAVLALAHALNTVGDLRSEDLASGLAATRARLRAALQDVTLEGASGTLRFDAHGDVRRPVPVVRVEPAPGGGYVRRVETSLGVR